MSPLADVRSIAVLRANGIGDLMFALPALDSIRAAYPAARVTLLGTPWQHAFWAGRPGSVDEVLVVPVSRGVREEDGAPSDPAALDAFFERARARRFDLALQLHGGGAHSNPFVLRLGARTTAGLAAPGAPELDHTVPYRYYQSEVLRLLEVAAAVGAPAVTLAARLEVTAGDEAAAETVHPSSPRPLAVLHPGAGDPRRRWPSAAFATVGDALASAGAEVVVTGGPGDRALAAAVVAGMRRPAHDVSGRLGLGGSAGLLARARVVVGNDSGPLHLAAAVGAATVGIYWCGNLINAAPFTRSRHRPLASWRLDCPVCGVDCTRAACPHDASFVAEVPVDEVVTEALDLLGR